MRTLLLSVLHRLLSAHPEVEVDLVDSQIVELLLIHSVGLVLGVQSIEQETLPEEFALVFLSLKLGQLFL